MVPIYMYLFISSCLLQWSGGNAFTPVVYPAKSLPASQCGQSNPLQDDQQLMETLKMIHQQLPPPGCNPPTTCAQFLHCNSSASSGYYQIQATNGSAMQILLKCSAVWITCMKEQTKKWMVYWSKRCIQHKRTASATHDRPHHSPQMTQLSLRVHYYSGHFEFQTVVHKILYIVGCRLDFRVRDKLPHHRQHMCTISRGYPSSWTNILYCFLAVLLVKFLVQ